MDHKALAVTTKTQTKTVVEYVFTVNRDLLAFLNLPPSAEVLVHITEHSEDFDLHGGEIKIRIDKTENKENIENIENLNILKKRLE